MAEGLTPEKLEQLRRLVRSGYVPTVEANGKSLCAPYWHSSDERGFKGGTLCFVHTGERLIGVTAEHVHRECVECLEHDTDPWCQVGGHTFDPTRCLLDADRDLDLAVYALSEVQVSAARHHIHYAPEWPPVIDERDVYIVAGWPWSLTTRHARSDTHRYLNIVSRLAGASDRHIGIATFTSTSIPWGTSALPPGTNLGGMSGGPVYRLREGSLAFMTLVGIIYEYQPSFEFILARPLSLVNRDGFIRRDR